MRKKLNGCKCSVVGCDRKATGWQDMRNQVLWGILKKSQLK